MTWFRWSLLLIRIIGGWIRILFAHFIGHRIFECEKRRKQAGREMRDFVVDSVVHSLNILPLFSGVAEPRNGCSKKGGGRM